MFSSSATQLVVAALPILLQPMSLPSNTIPTPPTSSYLLAAVELVTSLMSDLLLAPTLERSFRSPQ